jgi:hypothetical protein
MEAALQSLARMRQADSSDAAGRMALDLLLTPRGARSMEGVDKFLERQGIVLGQPLGAGGEAAVFDAGQHVVKISADPFGQGPYNLPDIPGVAPYVAARQVGPFRIGVQPRAREVASRDRMAVDDAYYRLWRDRSDTLFDSLGRRSKYWDDAGALNAGIMPDGNLAVIDGWLRDQPPPTRIISRYPTVEDAIRALRVEPQ